jgi:protease-4
MIPQPPSGQDPVDPKGAFSPPPAPREGPAPANAPGVLPGGPRPYQQQAGFGLPMPPMPPMPPAGMPPMMMPPSPFMPAFGPPLPPPRRGRGFLRALLILALVASVVFNLVLLAGHAIGGRSALQTSLVDGDVHETIAVIPVSGMILETTAERFNRHLTAAEHDPNVKAIVVSVDTPGGMVTPSDEIYHRIDQFKVAHPSVPLVVSMGFLATSGGYYVSSRADWIVAQPTTWTGNIGVLAPRYNASELAQKWGVRETTVTAPKVGFKNSGSMFSPVSEADTQYWQGLVDGAYHRFLKVVKDGRGSRLTKPIEEIADGKVYLAADALKVGLVDQIGFPDDAYSYAAKQAGLLRPMVVKYRDPPSLMEIFGSESKVNGGATSATVNGVNVNVDAAGLLDAFATPRVLYMWRGQ